MLAEKLTSTNISQIHACKGVNEMFVFVISAKLPWPKKQTLLEDSVGNFVSQEEAEGRTSERREV